MNRLIVFLTALLVGSSMGSMENSPAHSLQPNLQYERYSNQHEMSLHLNGEKIAYLTYHLQRYSARLWEINFIFVEPEYRNKGYCRLLFVECFKDLIKRNAHGVAWDSCPFEGNLIPQDLNALYQRLIASQIIPLKNGTLNTIAKSPNNTRMFYNFC